MTPNSSLFVNQLRLEFSFLVSSSPIPWVLAQPHLRASPNTIAAPLLLSSSNFRTFILLHGSFINSAWLLLGFLTLEDGLILWYQSLGWSSLTSRDKFIFLVVFLWAMYWALEGFWALKRIGPKKSWAWNWPNKRESAFVRGYRSFLLQAWSPSFSYAPRSQFHVTCLGGKSHLPHALFLAPNTTF